MKLVVAVVQGEDARVADAVQVGGATAFVVSVDSFEKI